jgi:hypothetical protein
VLALDTREVLAAYGMTATPSVVIVAPDGRIASRPQFTRAMTEAVIRNALYSHFAPRGDPATVLRIVTVNGDGRGRRTGGQTAGTSAA